MENKFIITIVVAMLVIPIIYAAVCPSTNQFDLVTGIPCEAVTPIITEDCSAVFNASILYLNDTSINQSLTMNNKFDDVYNFSFNLTSQGTYFITLCDNSTATVQVGEFLEFYSSQTYIYIFLAIIGVALLIFGFYKEREYMVFMGGVSFIILGTLVLINGIQEVTSTLLQQGIAYVSIGIGIFFMVTAYIDFGGEL